MNEAELLATLQVVFVLLCGVLVFSLICTVVVAVKEYHRTRVVRHTAKHSRGPEVPVSNMVVPVREYRHTRIVRHAAKHSRGPEVPVSNMVVPKSTVEGATGGVFHTPSAPQSPAVKEDAQSTPPVAESPSEEPKQTWSQPSGYSHAPRKRHARHGR